MNCPILNVEEAAKVCKDCKKWKKILKGCPDVGLPQKGNGIYVVMYVDDTGMNKKHNKM
jgi:hypothetical protein